MHIHLPWLLFLLLGVCIAILFFTRNGEQRKLERTDLREEFKRKNRLK